jgi:hypothetical protein
MDNEFSFYFNYQRITNCDPEYLKDLYKDVENGEEIVEGRSGPQFSDMTLSGRSVLIVPNNTGTDYD